MELSDQLKKELKKYCLLLHAYSDTSWTISLWCEADDDYIDRFDNKIVFQVENEVWPTEANSNLYNIAQLRDLKAAYSKHSSKKRI